ncbi:unnamed protein product [Brachionus calyciflorus]|uniref:SCP domain-containing protein n=1 Tax=Brachionus calyciflorus TaxID=104777 RepID=A0A814HNW3_9BILA|nr:unnamed protein product [Brachionus calyciflorus]
MSEQNFAIELLSEHNLLREKFGNVTPLELDADLSLKAQAHADNLAENQSKLVNSTDEEVGENLYYLESDDGTYDVHHIIDYWVQKSHIDLNSQEKPTRTSHFTQIVWKNSSKLGVGLSKAGNGGIYVVAFYHPRGNIVNYIDENVLISHPSDSVSNSDHEHENSDSNSDHKNHKKEKKPEDKVNHVLEKIVKKADKEKTGKISLTKAKKVFQLINEKFGTHYTNMDAKTFFEKFENLDETGKVGHREFRRALSELGLKLNH